MPQWGIGSERLGVQSRNIRVAKIVGLAFRDLQGGEFGGPVVGKLVKLFGETRTVIQRWRNKGEAAFSEVEGSSSAVEGQTEAPNWGGGPRRTQIVLLKQEVVGCGGQEMARSFPICIFSRTTPPQSQHGPL